MGIEIEKNGFVKDLRTVGKIINNRVLELDTSYLKVSYVEGSYWLSGFGSQHDLVIKLEDGDGEEQSKNIEYSKMWELVNLMQDDITLELTEKGVHVNDINSQMDLVDLMSDNDDVEDIKELISLKNEIEEDGFTVNREDFLQTIKYLRNIQDREDRDDIQTGVMMSKDSSYIASDLYAVRHGYNFPIDIVLDSHTVKVLLDLLESVGDEDVKIVRDGSFTWFLVEDSLYRVDALEDAIEGQYKKIFKHRKVDDVIVIDKKECLRMLNMTKVLTDSVESDINFKIEDGKGRIYTETQDGDLVDGTFEAGECQDVEFTVSVENMIGVISNLPDYCGNELEFEVVIVPIEKQFEEQELLHLRYGNGDYFEGECIFSINTDLD